MATQQTRLAGPKLDDCAGGQADAAALIAESAQCNDAGRHRDGAELAARAHDAAESAGDRHTAARALVLLATHQMRLGQYETAISTSESALSRHRLLDPADLTDVLAARIMACGELGLHDEALQAVDECLTAAERSGDPVKRSWAKNRAGCAYDAMGNHGAATELLVEALALARRADSADALFAALNNLAENGIALAMERHRQNRVQEVDAIARNRAIGRECVAAAEALENAHCYALARGTQGMTEALSGDIPDGLAAIEEAAAIARAHVYPPLIHLFGLYRGQALLLAGRVDEAAEQLQQTLVEAREGKDHAVAMVVMRELKCAFQRAGRYREALDQFEELYEHERRNYQQVAQLRARMMADRLELERARLAADRARLEAELLKVQHEELETEKQRLEDLSAELSLHANQDALTGLWNRRYFDARLPQAFGSARQHGEPLSVALIDIDHFKSINDRFGHEAGDEVLRQVAEMLRGLCRPTDMLARYGGEEFVLLMPGTSEDVGSRVCERLCRGIRRMIWPRVDRQLSVTVSIGLCGVNDLDSTAEALREADRRLYSAKGGGRDRVVPSVAGDEIADNPAPARSRAAS